jgi:uncharacterized protein
MGDPEGQARASVRLEFIDSLRGFALFGVFWANLLIFSGIGYMTDAQRSSLFTSRFDAIAFFIERFFIENKFMGLFSFLFGISFWLFLSSVRARGESATSLFYRRIFWLFIIGAVHGWLLWCFDILRFYALWAVFLPLFVRTAPRRLLSIALITSILIPALVAGWRVWMSTPSSSPSDFDAMALTAFSNGSYRAVLLANWKYDWYLTLAISQISYQVAVVGRLLLGLYAARMLALGNLESHRSLLRKVLLVGGVVGMLGSIIFAGGFLSSSAISPLPAFVRRCIVESGQLGLTLAYAAGMALLFLTIRGRPLVRLLAPIGRMALSCYLLQTVFGIWVFYGFARGPALMGKVGPALLMTLAFVGFVVQIVFARVWLKWFRFGPAEWLWRSLTYWSLQPLSALASDASQQAAGGTSR